MSLAPYRGLLLPKIVVDDFGGTRSDPGMLGAGIYFADTARYCTCVYNNYAILAVFVVLQLTACSY